MTRFLPLFLLLAAAQLACVLPQDASRVADTAEAHSKRGVEFHLRRCLNDANQEYTRVVKLDPPRELSADEWKLVRRFAPRVYTTPTEIFPLKDFAVIVHPAERLIAYHFFWEDDIDFPDDGDPCDHELVWVRYSQDKGSIEGLMTYYHGRILEGGRNAIEDARAHEMRPRINVQWGKHGSLLIGWEGMKINVDPDDNERKYYPSDRTITVSQDQQSTYRRLSEAGHRLINHPISQRLGWPRKFTGSYDEFVDFSRFIDPLQSLEQTKLARVSLWNNATINQYFLTYNFRPKTEWPEDKSKSN